MDCLVFSRAIIIGVFSGRCMFSLRSIRCYINYFRILKPGILDNPNETVLDDSNKSLELEDIFLDFDTQKQLNEILDEGGITTQQQDICVS